MSAQRSFPPYVYFVRRVDGEGPVKIGCSQFPEERLSALMTWAPYPLEIVATIPGDEDLERRFHAKFAAQHTHREWFTPSPELTEVVAQVCAGAFDVETLPAPKCVTNGLPRKPWSEEQKLGVRWGHAIEKQRRAGRPIPKDVTEAIGRWGAGRYSPYFDASRRHDDADRATITAFLDALSIDKAA